MDWNEVLATSSWALPFLGIWSRENSYATMSLPPLPVRKPTFQRTEARLPCDYTMTFIQGVNETAADILAMFAGGGDPAAAAAPPRIQSVWKWNPSFGKVWKLTRANRGGRLHQRLSSCSMANLGWESAASRFLSNDGGCMRCLTVQAKQPIISITSSRVHFRANILRPSLSYHDSVLSRRLSRRSIRLT